MASGWWKSSYDNLDDVSPADFTVTTALSAPRNWDKIATICTASGAFYQGATPSVVVDDVIYFAGDSYTQGTHNPPLYRYDGRVCTKVLELPYYTGSTPRKAILSLATDEDNRFVFISTWDTGTGNTTIEGSVYAYEIADGTLTRIDYPLEGVGGGLFTDGLIPYAMACANDALYVGASLLSPSSTGQITKLSFNGHLYGGPVLTCTLTGTTYTYEVGALNGSTATGTFTANTPRVSCKNRATLNGSFYNTLSWGNSPVGTQSYRLRDVSGSRAVFFDIDRNPALTTYNDTGADLSSGAYSDVAETMTLTVTPFPAQSTTSTYRVTAIINDFEFSSANINVTTPAQLYNDLYVKLDWTAITGATAYRIYRVAGHTSTGLIGETASLTFNDTGLAGNGTVPSDYITYNITSGSVVSLINYNDDLYAGTAQAASTFGFVHKLSSDGVVTTSRTAAPGGTARINNGYTAGIVWNGNLYMAYWNNDTTKISLIEKFNGSSWSTVKTISGAGAVPFIAFAATNTQLWVYGGGDGTNGALYVTTDGTSWTDQSALLPTSREALPVIGTSHILGGF